MQYTLSITLSCTFLLCQCSKTWRPQAQLPLMYHASMSQLEGFLNLCIVQPILS